MKRGSNESSGHDVQFCPRILKIGAFFLQDWFFQIKTSLDYAQDPTVNATIKMKTFILVIKGNHECTSYLIIALCLHAVYTVHNSIRHGLNFRDLDEQSKFKCLHQIILQKPLSAKKNPLRKIASHLRSVYKF